MKKWSKTNIIYYSQTVGATITGGTVAAELPTDRPIAYYLSVTDGREAMVSTEYAELR